MNKITVKFISAILSLSIVFTNGYSYAYPTLFKATSHAQRYLTQNEPKQQLSIVKDPSVISIPQQIGTILEYYKGKGDALIIHIQDRHADPIAQLNISSIIDEFVKKHKVSLMMLEGASSELDTSFYDSFEDNEIKQKVSKLFVDYAIFTGAEYYKITNKDKYLRAIGAEDRSLYFKHLDAHKKNMVDQESMLLFLKAVGLSLDSLKDILYTKDQKRIDNSSNLYLQGSVRFPEYIKTLNSVAKKTKTGLDKYENLAKFISLVQKEEEIDFKKAESQREAVIKKLSGILNKIDLNELLRKSMEFRTAILSQEEFYDYLFNLIGAQDFKASEYNHLSAYVEYIKLSKDINHLKAFDEADDFEYEIMLYLSTTQPQKDLILYSRSAKLLKGLYSLKLTPRQLLFLERYKESSDLSNIKTFLIRTSSQYGINLLPAIISFSIDSSLMNQSKQYYSLALERDTALIKNTLHRMKRLRKDKAILITGGFHTKGITNILKQKDLSYIVICPNICQKEFDSIYNDRIAGSLPGVKELESALTNTLSPKLQTDISPEGVSGKTSSSGVKELFRSVLLSASLVAKEASPEIPTKSSSAGDVAPEAAPEDGILVINSEDIIRHNVLGSEVYEVTIKGGDGTVYIEKKLYNSPISSGENELIRLQKLAQGNVKGVPRLITKVRYPDQERFLIERIDGEMLADVMKDADRVKGLLKTDFFLKLRNIVLQAHGAGIAHNDIQGRNVIVASNNTPILIDWDVQTYRNDHLDGAKQLDFEELSMFEDLCKDIVLKVGTAIDPKASSAGGKGTAEEEREARWFLDDKRVDLNRLEADFGEIINLYGYRDFRDLYIATGSSAAYVFSYGLPAVKNLFTEDELKTYWHDLVELGKAAGENAMSVFSDSLPQIKNLFTEDELKIYWHGILELGKAAGENAGYLFLLGLPELKKQFTENEFRTYWQDFVELGKGAGENAGHLFDYGLPEIKNLFTAGELETYWQDIVELGKAAGKNVHYLFIYGLPAVRRLINDRASLKTIGNDLIGLGEAVGEKAGSLFRELATVKNLFTEDEFKTYWHDLVELGKSAGENAGYLFREGLPALKNIFTEDELKTYWHDLVELGKAAGKNAGLLFKYGLPAVNTLITNRESLNTIGRDLIRILQLSSGAEYNTLKAIRELSPLIEQFPSSWRTFFKPVIFNQTQGAYLCLGAIKKILNEGAILSEDDLAFLRGFIITHGIRAYDLLENFIYSGMQQGVIAKPVSAEKDSINNFLSSIPYAIIEVYQAYKNNPSQLEELKRRCENIHRKILSGDTKDVDRDSLFAAMLMHVFPPEVTTQREQYLNLYTQRPDRPQDTRDIPDSLQGRPYNVSTGSYTLKDPSAPLDETSWQVLLEVVSNVNREDAVSLTDQDIALLGEQLLTQWQSSSLYSSRKELLSKLYIYFRHSRGQMLPSSLGTMTNIMSLKQFMGDTLRDLITECVSKYSETNHDTYNSLLAKMFKAKIANPKAAAKAVSGILTRFKDNPEQAKEALARALKIEDNDALDNIWSQVEGKETQQEIEAVLKDITLRPQEGKEATLISHQLQGSDYKTMQAEISGKYEFNEGQEKLSLRFVVSKRKAHGAAGLNMGVCVAPDAELWSNPNFMNVIIFGENNIALGGMHILIVEDEGQRYLVLPGINPSIGLLTKVAADDIYDKLMDFANELARELKCKAVLIPTSATIHSNRSEMQRVIAARNYKKILANGQSPLTKIHPFSYSPKYSVQDCYVAGESAAKASSAGDTSARRALPLTVNIEADMLEKVRLRLAESVESANRGLTDRGMDGVTVIDSAVLFRSEINTLLEQLASISNFDKMTEQEKMQLPVYRRFIKVIHYIELYQYELEWVKRYIEEADTAENVSSLLYHKSFLDANITELSKVFQSPVTDSEAVVRYLDPPKKLFATHATQPDYLVLMAISGLMDFDSARNWGVTRKSGGVLNVVSFQVGQVQRVFGQEPNPYPYEHPLHKTFSGQGYSYFQMTKERPGGQYGVFIPYANLLRDDGQNRVKLYTNSAWNPGTAGVKRRKILELGRDGAEQWMRDIYEKVTVGEWAQAYIDGDVSLWPSANNHSYKEMMRAVNLWREIGVAQTGYEPIFLESSQKGETQGEIETNAGLNLHEEEAMLMVPRINLNKFVRDFLKTVQELADAPGNTNLRDAIEKTGGVEQYARNALSLVVPYGESNLQLAMVTLENADLGLVRRKAQEEVNTVLHSVFSAGAVVTPSIDDKQDLGVIVSGEDGTPSGEIKASSAGLALEHIAELRTSTIGYLESVRDNPYNNHFGLPQYGLIIYDSTLREDTIDVIRSLASLRNFRGEYVFEIVVVPSKNGRNLIGKMEGNIRMISADDVEEEAEALMLRKPVGIIAGAEVGDVAGLAMEIESAKRRNGDNWYVFVTSQVPSDIEIKGSVNKDFVAFEPMLADILNKFRHYNSLKERLDMLTLQEKLGLLCAILPAITEAEFMQRIEVLQEAMDLVGKAA